MTELENLIILLNIGSLSFLGISFIAYRSLVLIFAMQERKWRSCTTGSHWIVIVYLSRKGRNLKLLLLLLLLSYFIPIAAEHKSHGNMIIPDINLNMNITCVKYTRFSIWIIPDWRRNQTSLLDPAPLGTAIFRCHVVIYLSIDRSESRTRYFGDGKLIIGAAKLVDLDNYIKVFRGYFTNYIHASTLFFSIRTF